MSPKLPLQSFGVSDIGIARANNEDVWLSLPECGFFAVADGMGGHQAGEIAATETLHSLSQFVRQVHTEDPTELIIEMRYAIETVNRRIHQLGKTSMQLSGMGTTLCCLMWTKEVILYAHVGDSRIYRLRQGKLELLTQDHSFFTKWLQYGKLAEECETPYPYRNVITRAIGGPGKANPEIAIASPNPEDLYLLCSDGLSDALPLQDMESILIQSQDLPTTAEKLIETAKFKGGFDNMTLLLVRAKPYEKNVSR